MATKMTIRDIARLAGVSSATISRVLNEKPDVDPVTRERIQRIMDEQQFVPSVAGSGLAGGRTGLIGVLVPSLTWAIMSPVLSGVADVLEMAPYELVLYSLGRKQGRGETIHRIIDAKLIDGLIAIYPDGATRPGDVADEDHSVADHLSRVYEQGFPVVVIDDQRLHDNMPWISSDNRQGALDAVRHLIAQGHRRIAHISGPKSYLCTQERLAGYRAALEEMRFVPDRELEVPGDFTFYGGQEAAACLFDSREPPTAIFAANDDMAYGVLEEARQRGLSVPEDVAVVGFDDAERSAFTRPILTTVRQPFFESGRRAAVTLVSLVDATRQQVTSRSKWSNLGTSSGLIGASPAQPRPIHVELRAQLLERQSTLAAKRSQEVAGVGGEGRR